MILYIMMLPVSTMVRGCYSIEHLLGTRRRVWNRTSCSPSETVSGAPVQLRPWVWQNLADGSNAKGTRRWPLRRCQNVSEFWSFLWHFLGKGVKGKSWNPHHRETLNWSDQNRPLVGGWPTPLKNMIWSVGMMTFPTYGKIKCSKPPTRPLFLVLLWNCQSPLCEGVFWSTSEWAALVPLHFRLLLGTWRMEHLTKINVQQKTLRTAKQIPPGNLNTLLAL